MAFPAFREIGGVSREGRLKKRQRPRIRTFPFKFKSVASARAGERARTMVCKGKPR